MYHIVVTGHCVYALVRFFTFVLIGGLVNLTLILEHVTAVAKAGFLLLLPRAVRPFAFDAGLHSVFQSSHFYSKRLNRAYCFGSVL